MNHECTNCYDGFILAGNISGLLGSVPPNGCVKLVDEILIGDCYFYTNQIICVSCYNGY